MEQLSLWDATCFDPAPKRELPAQRESTESKEDYERRRTTEMAEKLGWPPHTHRASDELAWGHDRRRGRRMASLSRGSVRGDDRRSHGDPA